MKGFLTISVVTGSMFASVAFADLGPVSDSYGEPDGSTIDSVPINAEVNSTFIVTPNERLPPDYFLAPGETGGKYVFPPKLEKACTTSKSSFCPSYGEPDGIPSDWVIARYKSRHAGGFDGGTASLLMVYVPPGSMVKGQKDRVHRWLNFALPTDPAPTDGQPTPRSPIPVIYDDKMPRTFTMVSLTEGDTANVHFQKFTREGNDNFYIPDDASYVDGCYRCHPNGLRAISPLGYHVDAAEAADPNEKMLEEANWNAVQKINNAMERAEGGRAVTWDQGFDPSKYTNILGPSTPKNPRTRTREYILGNGTTESGCAKIKDTYVLTDIFDRAPGRKNIYKMSDNPRLDWEKIRDAMNCESCHDHTQRGAITDKISPDQINFKILVDQSMPLGSLKDPYASATDHRYSNSLDVDHRIALANCLRKELEDSSN